MAKVQFVPNVPNDNLPIIVKISKETATDTIVKDQIKVRA
jgi:hypothetical protein